MMKLVLAVMVGVALLVPRIADACGYWKMQDEEKSYQIGFHINSGTITKDQRKVAFIYLDEAKTGLRSVRERKVVFDVKNGKLTKYGKAIATINADGSVAFGKRVYTIQFSNQHDYHGMPAWDLLVERDGARVVSSKEATALCMQGQKTATEEQMQNEVRRRVMFYLAWRETGA